MSSLAEQYALLHDELTAAGSPFEMVPVEVGGRPLRTWKHAPTTLRQLLDRGSERGDAEYMVYGDERWTFAAHHAAVSRLATLLTDEHGVEPGDRVAIAMRNRPEWPIAFWAATAVGAIAVPLNAWWTGAELEFAVTDSQSAVVICDLERHERMRAAGVTATSMVVPSADGDCPDDAWPLEIGVDVAGGPLATVAIDPEDAATLMYTSGTTGRPKGVLGTHRNICSSVTSLAFVAERDRRRAGLPASPLGAAGTILVAVPFFHATGLHGLVVGSMAAGNRMVLMHKWDAGEALRCIEAERVTAFSGVPAMVRQLVDHPDAESADLSSLRGVTSGGAAAAPELVGRTRARLGSALVRNGYGLTETSTVVTMNSGDDYLRRPDSVGVAIPVDDLRVVDEAGDDVATGAVGELLVRGPNVVTGYWRRAEATAQSFDPAGWFRTGDIARIDDDGFVYIVDRAKDIIIRGGENISSVEVEAVLFEHPDVADVAVIPVPHDVLGEEVGAVVQRRPSRPVTEAELQQHARGLLAAFKVPVRIWVGDEPLPRNPQGKVLKHQLRDDLLG